MKITNTYFRLKRNGQWNPANDFPSQSATNATISFKFFCPKVQNN